MRGFLRKVAWNEMLGGIREITMKCFGWTLEQIAYAKQRHKLHSGGDLSPNADGILALRKWWAESNWPDPLSVRLDGVVLESDTGWAATAMREVALIAAQLSRSAGRRGFMRRLRCTAELESR